MRPVREFALTVALDHGVPTVKTHVSSILTRLDLDNRVQIALLVHDAGGCSTGSRDWAPGRLRRDRRRAGGGRRARRRAA
jgi:hypothetical protein